jgi:hypothetical protein
VALVVPLFPRGRGKKRVSDPRGGWVGQRTKKDQVKFIFRFILFGVFELPSPRNAQKKRDKTNRQKIGLGFFFAVSIKFGKNFSTRFFCTTFFVVLLNSHRCEIPENAIKPKQVEEKLKN